MKRFRLSEDDIVKATLSINGQLVASLYNSGFTTKSEVFNTLCRKTHYAGMLAECHISVAEKMISTSFYKKCV